MHDSQASICWTTPVTYPESIGRTPGDVAPSVQPVRRPPRYRKLTRYCGFVHGLLSCTFPLQNYVCKCYLLVLFNCTGGDGIVILHDLLGRYYCSRPAPGNGTRRRIDGVRRIEPIENGGKSTESWDGPAIRTRRRAWRDRRHHNDYVTSQQRTGRVAWIHLATRVGYVSA